MNRNYALYPHPQVETLKEMLAVCSQAHKDKPAFIYPVNKNEDITVSHRQFKADVEAFGSWMFYNGYNACHVAVYGENSYEWILTHFAVTCGENVIVPIDKDLPVNGAKNLILDSECTVLVYSDMYSDETAQMELDGVRLINMKNISEYLTQGYKLIENGYNEYIDKEVAPESLATIVYTSGTTGTAKGVMLTHMNLATDMVATCQNNTLENGTILFLPLHHTFGLVAGVLCVLNYGHYIYLSSGLKNAYVDFLKARPQHIDLVPMVIEGIYKRIWITAEKQGKSSELQLLVRASNILFHIGIDLRRFLFKSILSSFGGRLNTIVSGGANIDSKYIIGFQSFGITVINGYGITECSPIVSTNRNKAVKCGTVGFPCSCNEVRIASPNENGEGEILVKGKNVMLGYWKNPEATKAAFDGEWFKTGDIGKIDNDGYLYVTGRLKNLIILANGKNVYPEELEEKLGSISEIKEAIVYAEADSITAEIFPDSDSPDCQTVIKNKINELNKTLPLYKQIVIVKFRETEFEKTTTKKIKR